MTATSRILVATDLSAPARHAVDRAYLLAEHAGGELLHGLRAFQRGDRFGSEAVDFGEDRVPSRGELVAVADAADPEEAPEKPA